MVDHSKLFYVLKGFVNGERGVLATPSGGGISRVLKDGHYYLLEGDPDGVGPYESVEDAWAAYEKAEQTQTWLFPVEGHDPFRMLPGQEHLSHGGGFNTATITHEKEDGVFVCAIEGSYEELTLRISCPDFVAAADVFRHVLLASHKYQ